jgi:hypothetical protein
MSGGNPEARKLAALLVNKTLKDRGFMSVEIVNRQGIECDATTYVPSILEMMRANGTKVFDLPVEVQEVKTHRLI